MSKLSHYLASIVIVVVPVQEKMQLSDISASPTRITPTFVSISETSLTKAVETS